MSKAQQTSESLVDSEFQREPTVNSKWDSLKGPLTIFGAWCINFVSHKKNAGNLNLWGIIGNYVTSWLYSMDSSVDSSVMFPTLPCSYFAEGISIRKIHSALVAFFMIRYGEQTGRRMGMILATVLFGGGLLACSFITSAYPFMVVYGIATGFGCGAGGMFAIYCAWDYYPDKKGTVTGICMSSFSVGPTFYGLLFTFLVNPGNKKASKEVDRGEETNHFYDSDVNDRVPMALLIVAIIGMAIGVVGLLCIRQRKSGGNSVINASSIHMTFKEIVFTREFSILFLSLMFTFVFWAFIANDYKVFGLTKIDNDQLLSLMGSVGSGIATIARFTWGWMLDNMKFKWVMTINAAVAIAQSFTIYFVADIAWLYFIYVIVAYLNGAGNYPIYAVQCGRLYKNQGASVWSVMVWGLTSGTLITILVDLFLVTHLGYLPAFMLMGGLVCIGAVLLQWTPVEESQTGVKVESSISYMVGQGIFLKKMTT